MRVSVVVFNGLLINHSACVGGLLSSFWRDHFWTPTNAKSHSFLKNSNEDCTIN